MHQIQWDEAHDGTGYQVTNVTITIINHQSFSPLNPQATTVLLENLRKSATVLHHAHTHSVGMGPCHATKLGTYFQNNLFQRSMHF